MFDFVFRFFPGRSGGGCFLLEFGLGERRNTEEGGQRFREATQAERMMWVDLCLLDAIS